MQHSSNTQASIIDAQEGVRKPADQTQSNVLGAHINQHLRTLPHGGLLPPGAALLVRMRTHHTQQRHQTKPSFSSVCPGLSHTFFHASAVLDAHSNQTDQTADTDTQPTAGARRS
jgi:hypothetical protein